MMSWNLKASQPVSTDFLISQPPYCVRGSYKDSDFSADVDLGKLVLTTSVETVELPKALHRSVQTQRSS